MQNMLKSDKNKLENHSLENQTSFLADVSVSVLGR